MTRSPAWAGMARAPSKGASSIACLAFVGILAVAFWTGAVWLGNVLLQVLAAN